MDVISRVIKSPSQKVMPANRIDKELDDESENETFRFVSPDVIDVDFEEVRSFPSKYTIITYNNRGDIVCLECAPSFVNVKA